MENLLKKEGQLTLDSIRLLATQKMLRERLKPGDTFYIPNPQLTEIESVLNDFKVGYKKTAHPTYTLTLFTVLN